MNTRDEGRSPRQKFQIAYTREDHYARRANEAICDFKDERVSAGLLCAAHVDLPIQFRTVTGHGDVSEEKVHAVVWGKLRQVYHASDGTTVNVMTGNGSLDLEEFTLDHDQIVVVSPVQLSIAVDKDEQP